MNRPRFDTYSKIVLTVIAVCLVWLCLDRMQIVPQADAQVKPGDVDTVHDVVKAKAFLLVDEKGKHRAILGGTVFGSCLVLYDENERVRAGLGVTPHGAEFKLYYETEQACSTLEAGKNGVALVLKDRKGHKRTVLGVADLDVRVTPEATKTGEYSLRLFDKDGNAMWQANTSRSRLRPR